MSDHPFHSSAQPPGGEQTRSATMRHPISCLCISPPEADAKREGRVFVYNSLRGLCRVSLDGLKARRRRVEVLKLVPLTHRFRLYYIAKRKSCQTENLASGNSDTLWTWISIKGVQVARSRRSSETRCVHTKESPKTKASCSEDRKLQTPHYPERL